MIVRDFVEVPMPLEATVRAASDPTRWARALAAPLDAQERAQLARFGIDREFAVDGPGVTIGRPRRQERGTVLDVAWESGHANPWFPAMHAEVLLSSLGPTWTHVEFSGSYDLRGGLPRTVADRLVLYRVGEHTVRLVLTRLVEELKGVPV